VLDIGFDIRPSGKVPRLDGSGMVVVNPPFMLEAELKVMLPELHRLLSLEPGAKWSVNWLAGEQAGA
jgi:23S rRNA (adenine2030-N6)-methyltransferase